MSTNYRIPNFEAIADRAILAVNPNEQSIEHRSYQNEHKILLDWFQKTTTSKSWNADLVRLAGLAIYGWMPTILRAEGRKSVERGVDFVQIADRLNNQGILEEDYIFLNGSVVGTSKFLHFWDPERFAIWDSNIRNALRLSPYGNALKQFSDYLLDIRLYSEKKSMKLRDIEFALFRLGDGD